jgi:hypothetical protein
VLGAAACPATPGDALGPFYEPNAPVRSKVGTGHVMEVGCSEDSPPNATSIPSTVPVTYTTTSQQVPLGPAFAALTDSVAFRIYGYASVASRGTGGSTTSSSRGTPTRSSDQVSPEEVALG